MRFVNEDHPSRDLDREFGSRVKGQGSQRSAEVTIGEV